MTFEEMSFSEKMEHIWEYYKFHMAVAAGVLLLVGSLLNIYLINPAPDAILDITVRVEGQYFDPDYAITLTEMLKKELVEFENSQTVMVELLETGDGLNAQMMMASEAKFMGKAEVEELDLILMDEEQFRLMVGQGFFLNINDLEVEHGIDIPDELEIVSTDPITQKDMVFVVDANLLPKLKPLVPYVDQPYYLGIFVRSRSTENALKAITFLAQ